MQVLDAQRVDERYSFSVECRADRIGDLPPHIHYDGDILRVLLIDEAYRILRHLPVVAQLPYLINIILSPLEWGYLIVGPELRVEMLIQVVVELSADNSDLQTVEYAVLLGIEFSHNPVEGGHGHQLIVDLLCPFPQMRSDIGGVASHAEYIVQFSVDESDIVSGVFGYQFDETYIAYQAGLKLSEGNISGQLSGGYGEHTYHRPPHPVAEGKCKRGVVA